MDGYQKQGQRQGHSLRVQLQAVGMTDLRPGAIVTVTDRKLSFPHNVALRKVHERRFAVVLSNQRLCQDSNSKLIVIVPMTHNVGIQSETDVLIRPESGNGLLKESLVQLILIQPALK